MRHYLDHPIITLDKQLYLSLIIILMPILNFLGGINIDIYSPSMPAIFMWPYYRNLLYFFPY